MLWAGCESSCFAGIEAEFDFVAYLNKLLLLLFSFYFSLHFKSLLINAVGLADKVHQVMYGMSLSF